MTSLSGLSLGDMGSEPLLVPPPAPAQVPVMRAIAPVSVPLAPVSNPIPVAPVSNPIPVAPPQISLPTQISRPPQMMQTAIPQQQMPAYPQMTPGVQYPATGPDPSLPKPPGGMSKWIYIGILMVTLILIIVLVVVLVVMKQKGSGSFKQKPATLGKGLVYWNASVNPSKLVTYTPEQVAARKANAASSQASLDAVKAAKASSDPAAVPALLGQTGKYGSGTKTQDTGDGCTKDPNSNDPNQVC